MSRIGKTPVAIPEGVKVALDGSHISVEGKLGKLTHVLNEGINAEVVENNVVLTRTSEDREIRAYHGLNRALINNMIVGVTEGYSKVLWVVGTGYSAETVGPWLKLNVGYSHDILLEVPEGVKVNAEAVPRAKNLKIGNQAVQSIITVSGIVKEVIGNFSAEIRKCRKPENYKGKGIRYVDERVVIKPGKSGK